MGKLFLIEASVDGDYTWLGVVIVIGTMVSLVYYLRVVSAVWMRPEPAARPARPMPAIAGASPDAPGDASPEPLAATSNLVAGASGPAGSIRGASRCALVVGAALLCGAATIVFGVAPSPLIDWASHAASSLTTLA
jgi:NADH-quinone oxidoreductase subunit N